MSLDPNNQLLRDRLEALTELDGRFSGLKLINWVSGMPAKRGNFSMVFRAFDNVENRHVALKFYDVSPPATTNNYRRQAFAREPQILERLLSRPRCLQLVRGLTLFSLVSGPGAGALTMGCEYFVIEWLEDQIDEYFLDPKSVRFSPIDKLTLFNEILLAVAALHRREVFHRDLKHDNLRACDRDGKRVVVAIDLGTAARVESANLLPAYGGPVGAIGYSSPEARCGLAGNRKLAALTDVYAVGCLLFELFNPDHFFVQLEAFNPRIDFRLAAMARAIGIGASEEQQVNQWNLALATHGSGVAPVAIDGPGSDIPPGIVPVIGPLLQQLTDFDHRKRPQDLEQVSFRVQSAIKLLRNEREYQRRLKNARERRAQRIAAIRKRDARFAARRLPVSPNV
jgi:serine/threonine protein kinase